MEDRELNQARSKPDTVDRPVRTARIFVHHHNSTQYYNMETVFFQYSPSSRPTSHLRCGQVELTGAYTKGVMQTSWLADVQLGQFGENVAPKCLRAYTPA